MCQTLTMVQEAISDWVASHSASYPPTVINITDGEPTDGDPESLADSIRNLETSDGKVLMYNCHISSTPGAQVLFPSGDENLPDDKARLLFRMSSVLPDPIRNVAIAEKIKIGEAARGFAFNADLVDLIRFLDIGTRPTNLR